jgi:hypothetical protein
MVVTLIGTECWYRDEGGLNIKEVSISFKCVDHSAAQLFWYPWFVLRNNCWASRLLFCHSLHFSMLNSQVPNCV